VRALPLVHAPALQASDLWKSFIINGKLLDLQTEEANSQLNM
jgi:hypothetical protein